MSRSRRKRKLGKCFCGHGHVPFRGLKRRGRQIAACPVLEYPDNWNDEREAFRRARERSGLVDEAQDPAGPHVVRGICVRLGS